MSGDGTPPDDDSITYLPVDYTRAQTKLYGPTDPRDTKATGGMRIGDSFVFVADGAMPRLELERVAQACDGLVQGRDTYSSLLYLSRAQIDDIPCLVQASQSTEVKVRWERLWVLSPFFSRLSRGQQGQEQLMAAFKDDLAGVHLLSKFAEQNNPAVRRLFGRLHERLLPYLLAQLVEQRADARRAMLLVAIIATMETQEEALLKGLSQVAKGEVVQQVLSMLYIRYRRAQSSRLSSSALKDRLQAWRR